VAIFRQHRSKAFDGERETMLTAPIGGRATL
jgi:hypothetical protein